MFGCKRTWPSGCKRSDSSASLESDSIQFCANVLHVQSSFLSLLQFTESGLTWTSEPTRPPTRPIAAEEFIAFLGRAQQLKVDFLPITWSPALDIVGAGATAEIRKAYVNASVELAFKRYKSRTSERISLKPITTEISILGIPSIRRHPNILTLEGISFEVKSESNVLPILVFEHSRHGDLEAFMRRNHGRTMSFADRLGLCADIAAAIGTLHLNGKNHTHSLHVKDNADIS